MSKRSVNWKEKKYIQDRMNEIFQDYALDEEDEEEVRIYMLFKHKDGRKQEKCLRFTKREGLKLNAPRCASDIYKEMGFYSLADKTKTPECLGLEFLWRDIDEENGRYERIRHNT